jgi:hypothetical protein
MNLIVNLPGQYCMHYMVCNLSDALAELRTNDA